MIDALVVGSGASAVNAAAPLVEAGLRVRMLDFGNRDDVYESLIPAGSFAAIRRSDPSQHRYFLGYRYEGVGFGGVRIGAQLTPPRQFVPRDAEKLLPVASTSFFPMESLALGGLAAAWGAGCPPFVDEDLEGFPIHRADLAPHYEAVAQRIGVSGARDDLSPFFGELTEMLPPLEIDGNARAILARYEKRRSLLNRRGFFLGRPRLALLSRDHRGRSASSYGDMDFWSDRGRSVYRPRWTVEELGRFENFEYRAPVLVERFIESPDGSVEVVARDERGESERHRARCLLLGAGTLGTTRIVLRSLGAYGKPVPLACNPHTYAPMINLASLGKPIEERRHSLAQLCFLHAAAGESTVGHLYSYRSLLGFKLVRESPLPHRRSFRLVQLLLSSFTIVLLQHADRPTERKSCRLVRAGEELPDVLEIAYELSRDEERCIEKRERAIVRSFRKLGCLCIRRVRPGHAASVHYAGTFPMTSEERELTTDPCGRLRGTRAVYLVDGAVFPRLPSKGLTFTMMANANRIATRLCEALRS